MMRRLHILVLLLGLTGSLVLTAHGEDRAYDLDITVDYDAATYDGRLTVRIPNTSTDSFSEIFFRLFANDRALYGDATLSVHAVTVQSASLPFATYLDDTILMVPLPEPLLPGDTLIMTLQFNGKASIWETDGAPLSGESGYGILTKTSSALTLTSFYPIVAVYSAEGWALDPSTGFGDALMSEAADYTVSLTTSDHLALASTGIVTETTQTNSLRTYRISEESARDFSLVLLEDAIPSQSEASNVTLRSWFSRDRHSAADQSAVVAVTSVQFLSERIGPAPYQEIEWVEVPLRGPAGVEFSGLILVSSSYSAVPGDIFFSIIIAHEIVHQWFFAGVGNDVSEHPWLDEGLATFLAYEILALTHSPAMAQDQFVRAEQFYQSAQQRYPRLAIPSPAYAFPDSPTYSSFVYSGGATFLDAVRQQLGNEDFYAALSSYYAEWLGRVALPMNLIEAFRDACQCDLGDLLIAYRIVP